MMYYVINMGKVYVWTWVTESLCGSVVCYMEKFSFPYSYHRYEDGSVRYLRRLVNSFDLLDYIIFTVKVNKVKTLGWEINCMLKWPHFKRFHKKIRFLFCFVLADQWLLSEKKFERMLYGYKARHLVQFVSKSTSGSQKLQI